MEAELGCATLAAAGIESVVSADDVGHMYPSLGVSTRGGIPLLVAPENLEEARTVLESPASELPPDPAPSEPTGPA
jgi:hypothetical protein